MMQKPCSPMVLLVSVVDESVHVENVKEGAHADEKLEKRYNPMICEQF